MTRQKRLEDVTAGRMADVFFSLHGSASQDPIYVSEVVSKSMVFSPLLPRSPLSPSVLEREL